MPRPGDAVRRAAPRVRAEVHDRDAAAGSKPRPERRRRDVEARASHASKEERGDDGVGRWLSANRGRPRVRHVEMGAEPVSDEPLPGPVQRVSVGVRCVQLALLGEQRGEEPDAGGGFEDASRQRLGVEPARDDVQLRLPRGVVDRAALERAAPQEPVVGKGMDGGCRRSPGRRWVVDRLRIRASRGDRRRARAPRGDRRAQPPAQEGVRARLAETRGAQQRPAFQVARRARLPRDPAPQAVERRAEARRPDAVRRHPAQPTFAQLSGGDIPSNASGSTSSASTSMPSTTRGPGREKYADPSTA